MQREKFLFLSAGISFILFLTILIFILYGNPEIDTLIGSGIIGLWDGFLDQVFIFLGHYLKAILVLIASGAIFILYKQKKRKESLVMFLALAAGYIFENLISLAVQRERPLTQLIEKSGFSFPSGHAVFSVILFSLLIYFYKDEIKNNLKKGLFVSINIFIIFVVGFSRIYLNVHWFTDVVAGFFLGLFTAGSILVLTKDIEKI